MENYTTRYGHTWSLQEGLLWQGFENTTLFVELEEVEQIKSFDDQDFPFQPELYEPLSLQNGAPALQDQDAYDLLPSGILPEEGRILVPQLNEAFTLADLSIQEGMAATNMLPMVGMSSGEDPIPEFHATEEYHETTVCPADLFSTIPPILFVEPYIWQKLAKNSRYQEMPATARLVTSKRFPKIWSLEFEEPNGKRHPFNVCDDPALPNCHIAQANRRDMGRHLDGAAHSKANGVVILPCPNCGEIFKSARKCTRVRHAKTCSGRQNKKRDSSEDTDASDAYAPKASSSGPIRRVRRRQRRNAF